MVLKSSSFSNAVLLNPCLQPSQFPQFLPFFFRSLPILICFQFSHEEAEDIFLAEVCVLVCLLGGQEQATFRPRDTGKPRGTSSQVLRAKQMAWNILYSFWLFNLYAYRANFIFLKSSSKFQSLFSGEGVLTAYSTAPILFSWKQDKKKCLPWL